MSVFCTLQSWLVCRPFWDPRLDHLDCVCCASILLHVIACEYYNNVAFTRTELGPKLLEIVLIVSNGLVLSLVFVFTAVTAVERKVKAAAIAAVCRTVAEEITSLQQQLSKDTDAFFRELSDVQSKVPTMGVGCRVLDVHLGSGRIMDWTFDTKGQQSWMIAFENGQQRYYTAELALRKLQLLQQEPSLVLEKPILLRELSLAVERQLGAAASSSCAVRALYFVLKATNGDTNFDSASDRGLPAILVTLFTGLPPYAGAHH